MSFLAPFAFALGALAIPLIVLYMLKSRRQRTEVSSTMLWQEAAEPVSSAVPWQPLKITPLLILQLLALAALVATLARPFFAEQTLLGPHTVFVIDTSGSMAMAGRFEAARERAAQLAADASAANLISVVEAGPQPKVLAAFVDDADTVQEALDGLALTGGPEDLSGAIRLARGLATPDRPTHLLVFSDGGLAQLPEEPVVGARHLKFDHLGDNLSITTFSTSASTEGTLRSFVEVRNGTGTKQTVRIALEVDGLPAATSSVEVEAGKEARVVVPIDAGEGEVLSVRIVGEPDALPLDDAAYLVVASPPQRTVEIRGESSPFLAALVDIVPGFAEAAPDVPADIMIVDGGQLPTIDRPAWIIATAQPPRGIKVVELVRNAAVTYQRPGEPILDQVDLSAVAVAEAHVVESFDWLPLVRAGDSPLILLGEVNGHRAVYFTFDLTHSNLPVQVGFPIMGARLLDWLAGVPTVETSSDLAGVPIALAPPPGFTTRVTDPHGATYDLDPGAANFTNTGFPGVYRVEYVKEETVEQGPLVVRRFAADEVTGAYRDLTVAPGPDEPEEPASLIREWAPWVLAVVLVLLAVEWWVGHQRPTWKRRRLPV